VSGTQWQRIGSVSYGLSRAALDSAAVRRALFATARAERAHGPDSEEAHSARVELCALVELAELRAREHSAS
jgi:hypothetical protein